MSLRIDVHVEAGVPRRLALSVEPRSASGSPVPHSSGVVVLTGRAPACSYHPVVDLGQVAVGDPARLQAWFVFDRPPPLGLFLRLGLVVDGAELPVAVDPGIEAVPGCLPSWLCLRVGPSSPGGVVPPGTEVSLVPAGPARGVDLTGLAVTSDGPPVPIAALADGRAAAYAVTARSAEGEEVKCLLIGPPSIVRSFACLTRDPGLATWAYQDAPGDGWVAALAPATASFVAATFCGAGWWERPVGGVVLFPLPRGGADQVELTAYDGDGAAVGEPHTIIPELHPGQRACQP